MQFSEHFPPYFFDRREVLQQLEVEDDGRLSILKRVFHYRLKHYKFKLLRLDASVLVRISSSESSSEFARIEGCISGLVRIWYTVRRYVDGYSMRQCIPKINNVVKPLI